MKLRKPIPGDIVRIKTFLEEDTFTDKRKNLIKCSNYLACQGKLGTVINFPGRKTKENISVIMHDKSLWRNGVGFSSESEKCCWSFKPKYIENLTAINEAKNIELIRKL